MEKIKRREKIKKKHRGLFKKRLLFLIKTGWYDYELWKIRIANMIYFYGNYELDLDRFALYKRIYDIEIECLKENYKGGIYSI